ncbi:MAG TPA: peptidoglycan-binding protein LysM [bacterium]|nr:peptidoglycan-binding protein LysM [bacterium]HNT66741.1 peptidoglycan-binding protein LysM [bacterium]HOX85110.1 peptidoglycan-binding protein LysM [bacterium]HPG47033.1 peptidoglycan-binding protein LysM [bacterium]HPM99379.1 peptidoglycan-binding protein LysM [bacterium]
MGLFDFIKNVGANVFGAGKEEAKAIEEMLNKDLAGKITNLKADFKDGVVTLSGVCDSIATREKAILLAGNVKGVAKVVADNLTAPATDKEQVLDYYEVKPGDSLSKIAKKYYGNAMKYPVIFEANREVIKNPDLIYPGQKLRIPKI